MLKESTKDNLPPCAASSKGWVPPPPPPPARFVPRPPAGPPPSHAQRVQLPEWAYVGPFDPHKWMQELIKRKIDSSARKSFFLLAQISDQGAVFANHCLSKLYKKSADGEDIGNPSALMHSMCLEARHNLMADMGLGWSDSSDFGKGRGKGHKSKR